MVNEWVYFLKYTATGEIVKSFPNGTNASINQYCLANDIQCYYHTIECPELLHKQGLELVLYV